MNLKGILVTSVVLSFAGAVAGPAKTIDSPALVKPSDTAIDAIISVQTAVEAELAKDADSVVTVMPLPDGDARSAAFNREFYWLTDREDKRVRWGGAKCPSWGNREAGSHLFRTEGPKGRRVFWWYERMKAKRDEIRASGGTFDVVMIGDSITHWWDRDAGKDVMPDLRRTYSVLNLGYGGDHAETALWRAKNGELDGYTAKVVTIMIGTNNQGRNDTVESTAEAIRELVATVRAKQPQAKVLLHAIFPRCSPECRAMREKSAKVTEIIRSYADGTNVLWCDFRPLFLKPDGSGRFDLLTDGTHPGVTGVRVWRDAMLPYFEKCTGKRHVPVDPPRKPYARCWAQFRADFAQPDSAAKTTAFVRRAAGFGYNGLCLDGFDGVAAWDAAAKKRFDEVKAACARSRVELIPILYQQPLADFTAQAEKVNALCSPAKWFVTTNRTLYASIDLQRDALNGIVKALRELTPSAEPIAMGSAFSGLGGSLSRDLTVATSRGHGYFAGRKWRTMALVPVDERGREYWMFLAFGVQSDDPWAGVIYWTDGGDYGPLEDVGRMAVQRW